MKFFILNLANLLLLLSCSSSTKIIKYGERQNEFYTNNHLREFLKVNSSPKVVLRIYEQKLQNLKAANSPESFGYLYNVMENELIKLGFSVKDRGTFNEIISKAYSSDLLKRELSDADLILEVVLMNDKVVYATNKVTSIRSKKLTEEVKGLEYKSLGAYVEYRFIMVKNNEIAGTFKFNYQPCAHGCPLSSFKFFGSGRRKVVKLQEALPQEIMQTFISSSIQELVHSLKEGA